MTLDEQLRLIAAECLDNGIGLQQFIDQVERKYIDEAMLRHPRNVTRAAKLLGVHRNTLHNRLRIIHAADKIARGRELLCERSALRRNLARINKTLTAVRRRS